MRFIKEKASIENGALYKCVRKNGHSKVDILYYSILYYSIYQFPPIYNDYIA